MSDTRVETDSLADVDSGWLPKLRAIIPSYGVSLIDDEAMTRKVRAGTAAVLKIENI